LSSRISLKLAPKRQMLASCSASANAEAQQHLAVGIRQRHIPDIELEREGLNLISPMLSVRP
jgi:hypothetical protein